MFWLGLSVGMMIGSLMGFLIAALCAVARGDDDDGNN